MSIQKLYTRDSLEGAILKEQKKWLNDPNNNSIDVDLDGLKLWLYFRTSHVDIYTVEGGFWFKSTNKELIKLVGSCPNNY